MLKPLLHIFLSCAITFSVLGSLFASSEIPDRIVGLNEAISKLERSYAYHALPLKTQGLLEKLQLAEEEYKLQQFNAVVLSLYPYVDSFDTLPLTKQREALHLLAGSFKATGEYELSKLYYTELLHISEGVQKQAVLTFLMQLASISKSESEFMGLFDEYVSLGFQPTSGIYYAHGKFLFIDGKLATAEESLLKVGSAGKFSAKASYILGAIETKKSNYAEAERRFSWVLGNTKASKDNSQLRNLAILSLARVFALDKDYSRSVSWYGKLSASELQATAEFEKALAYMQWAKVSDGPNQKRYYALAASHLNKLKLNADANLLLGQIHLNLGDFNLAHAYFRKVLNNNEMRWRYLKDLEHMPGAKLRGEGSAKEHEWLMKQPEYQTVSNMRRQLILQADELSFLKQQYETIGNINQSHLKTSSVRALEKQMYALRSRKDALIAILEDEANKLDEQVLDSGGKGGKLEVLLELPKIAPRKLEPVSFQVAIDGVAQGKLRPVIAGKQEQILFSLPLNDTAKHSLTLHVVYRQALGDVQRGLKVSTEKQVDFEGAREQLTLVRASLSGEDIFSKKRRNPLKLEVESKTLKQESISRKSWSLIDEVRSLKAKLLKQIQILRGLSSLSTTKNEKTVWLHALKSQNSVLTYLKAERDKLQASMELLKKNIEHLNENSVSYKREKMSARLFEREILAIDQMIETLNEEIALKEKVAKSTGGAAQLLEIEQKYIASLIDEIRLLNSLKGHRLDREKELVSMNQRIALLESRMLDRLKDLPQEISQDAKIEHEKISDMISTLKQSREKIEAALASAEERAIQQLLNRISRRIKYADNGLLDMALQQNHQASMAVDKIEKEKNAALEKLRHEFHSKNERVGK